MKTIKPSKKIGALPPYMFTKINALKAEAAKGKLDIIDLGMGNHDMFTPQHIVDRLCDTLINHPKTHKYPQAKGMPRFRKAVADWMMKRFKVKFNPDNEILALVGSKEGVAHLSMSYLDPEDIALVCTPAYPVHFNGVYLAGATAYMMPLWEENQFLPDFSKIPAKVLKKAKLMFLNYPNNPTAAVVEGKKFLKEAVAFCKKHGILLVYDNAYSELYFGDYKAPSIFEIPGARDVALEFHSFSKTFNMAGWRIGWVCGRKELVAPLEKFKSFLDYGPPTFIQLAAAGALEGSQECVREQAKVYERRMKKVVHGLQKLGWDVKETKGTMYVWAKLPPVFKKKGSMWFTENLLKETGVVVSPGVGFGTAGEGYIRMSLVTHDNRFHDAMLRIREFQNKYAPKKIEKTVKEIKAVKAKTTKAKPAKKVKK
ncbi:LL-diaminopimelate aminotransferase [Elusimicrobium posterum]|uniref:aminotransferase class I/II-fold pyridoxal phosphate-dependent enzyme n=1 Tax=Elusimicrobium posterum TaxID=3116653 RepID=UPI003C72ED00